MENEIKEKILRLVKGNNLYTESEKLILTNPKITTIVELIEDKDFSVSINSNSEFKPEEINYKNYKDVLVHSLYGEPSIPDDSDEKIPNSDVYGFIVSENSNLYVVYFKGTVVDNQKQLIKELKDKYHNIED